MIAHPQPKPAPAPQAPSLTPAEARALADELTGAMDTLLTVIERETELVRGGKLRDAMAFEPKKQELSRRYVLAIRQMRANQTQLAQAEPQLLATLRGHHDAFRSKLQVNLTVLATAHAVSENIVRGVNTEMQRRNMPSTYTASGRRATPGPRHLTPMTVSRSL
jgi:hypothetical protein